MTRIIGIAFLGAVSFLSLNQKLSAESCAKPSVSLVIKIPILQNFPRGDQDVTGYILLENLSDHPVVFAMGKDWPGPNFKTNVKVWSSDGHLAELTDFGKFLYAGGEPVSIRLGDAGGELAVGETTDRPFSVGVFYKFLRPGSYSIQVTEPDPENDKCSISSNVATFQLVDYKF